MDLGPVCFPTYSRLSLTWTVQYLGQLGNNNLIDGAMITRFCILLSCSLIVPLGSGFAVEDDSKFADVPVGVTSFGAAFCNGKIYLYGGHMGDAHGYYDSGQNKKLFELDLAEPGKWKELGEGPGLQGLALVAHGGNIYRLGGFNARNKKGEDQDLHSVKDFARFDFAQGEWKSLPDMPVARSSFDAVVLGDKIYVVGGWAMRGGDDTEWCEDAYSIDLSQEELKWTKLPQPPFQRRAMSVGFQGDKVYVVGGMQLRGGPTREVAIFDTQSNEWKAGPELPGEESMEGFGSSCFNVGGTLVASTYSGKVIRLSDDGSRWQEFEKLDVGRFFHRLVPVSENSFVLIGGANMESGKTNDTIQLNLSDASSND